MAVRIAGLRKAFGATVAVAGLDLTVAPGSFTVLVGPPKCGKSVLFRLLVGLEQADAGSITLDGADITGVPPGARRIGYVPQSFALYPNLSVRDNIAYPLRLARAPAAEVARQVDRAAGMLSITPLLDKTPDQLSGGEKQRTALARGLVRQAQVFVLDDPLVGLDYKLRERLMEDLKDLRRELGATFIYATSDSLEALRLATELVVLDDGCVPVAQDAPLAVYDRPVHRRAMELVGFPRANLLPGRVDGAVVRAGPLALAVAAGGVPDPVVGLRPEALQVGPPDAGAVPATVRLVEDLGGELVIHLEADGVGLVAARAARDGTAPAIDAAVGITVTPDAVRLFGADGAALAPGGAGHG